MARVWRDETELKILDDDHKRNIRIVLTTHPTDFITHPKRTARFIRTNRRHPR